MNKYEFLFSAPCPLGGPCIQYHGICQARFRNGDFDGYDILEICRDGFKLEPATQTPADWNRFMHEARWKITEHNTRPVVSRIIDAAIKGSNAPTIIVVSGSGRESNAREISIEALEGM